MGRSISDVSGIRKKALLSVKGFSLCSKVRITANVSPGKQTRCLPSRVPIALGCKADGWAAIETRSRQNRQKTVLGATCGHTTILANLAGPVLAASHRHMGTSSTFEVTGWRTNRVNFGKPRIVIEGYNVGKRKGEPTPVHRLVMPASLHVRESCILLESILSLFVNKDRHVIVT